MVSAVGVGVLGWIVLRILDGDLRKAPEQAKDVDEFARWMIAHRDFVPLAVLPVVAIGVWLTVRGRSTNRALWWVMVFAASLWLAAIFVAIVASFVMFLAPLYQYHPL